MLDDLDSMIELGSDDGDPGKDFFAVLFMAFFLCNCVFMFCATAPPEQHTSVNTSADASKLQIQSSMLAELSMDRGLVVLHQDKTEFTLPRDLDALKMEGHFVAQGEGTESEGKFIIVKDPQSSMSGGQLLAAVQMLNEAGIGLDFRTVSQ